MFAFCFRLSMFKIYISIINFIICIQLSLNKEHSLKDSAIAEKLYIQLFKKQRAEQLGAIKSFKKVTTYDKQYSVIRLMAENIFTVIQDSRAVIEASPFIPGVSEFPLENKIKEAMSNILENTALFSEIVLRFPDVTTSLLKINNNWDIILQWGIAFSHQMEYLLDKETIKLLKLVSQELNYSERDPNYINPYRRMEKQQKIIEVKGNLKQKKKKIRKGPRLSYYDEL